jgi:hypothetical protein
MKELLKSIINDLEKSAIGLAMLEAKIEGKDLKLVGQLAEQATRPFYDSLRKRVDDLA